MRIGAATSTTPARPWLMLALGVAAQAASTIAIYGVPFLVPTLQVVYHLSLVQSGVLVAAPTVGMVATLVAWGAAADRWGERVVMAVGLALCGLALLVAVLWPGVVVLGLALVVAGAFGASVNAASGRVVMGWFPVERRGLAMGMRQTAQPLGIGVASVVLPRLAETWGIQTAMLFPTLLSLVVSVAVGLWVIDPPVARDGAHATPSPYRHAAIWRVHGASALLVIPQTALSAFAFLYMVSVLHWPSAVAGPLMAGVQLFGAASRLLVGAWSDRLGDRLGLMRLIAFATAVMMALLALGDARHTALILIPLVIGGITSVSPNGLAFTASAELAGPAWTGRALGVQNTAQNVMGAFTPPLVGAVVTGSSYAVAFALCAIFPALAIAVVPARRHGRAEPVSGAGGG